LSRSFAQARLFVLRTSYVPKNLIFAAKHQADAPLELIEPTDPHVCVNISYDRRRVSRRPRTDQIEEQIVAMSEAEWKELLELVCAVHLERISPDQRRAVSEAFRQRAMTRF
jgi:hypothetical protein